jgi:hypothetical protein
VGASKVHRLLSGMVHPIAQYVEYFVLEDEEEAREDALRHIRTITGANLPPVDIGKIKNPVLLSDLGGWEAPIIPTPFLVLKVDWLGDGSEIGYYSEADLATSTYQLLGKITSVGSFTRAFGVDHRVQRSQIQIRLEDITRTFATKVRSGDYLTARFSLLVGSPYVLPHQFVLIARGYRVQDVAEISETEVEFTLLDGVEDLSGARVRPPTISDIGFFGSVSQRKTLSDGSNDWPTVGTRSGEGIVKVTKALNVEPRDADAPVTIPFAGSIYKAPLAACYVPAKALNPIFDAQNPVAVIVLGSSKNPEWMKPHYYANCKDDAAEGARNAEMLVYAGTPANGDLILRWNGLGATTGFSPAGNLGIRAYVEVVRHTAQLDGDDTTDPWYTAVLYISLDRRPYDADSSIQSLVLAKMGQLRDAMQKMKDNLSDIWIDANGFGASSAWYNASSGAPPLPIDHLKRTDVGPIGVIEYLARWHSGQGYSALHGTSRVIDSTEDAKTSSDMAEPVGGFISAEVSGSDVLAGLGSTFQLDLGVSGRGRLLLRPVTVTSQDRHDRIPNAKDLTDNEHIIDGTWQELAPKGSDRWGFGTLFKFDGIQNLLRESGFRATDRLETNSYSQEIDKAINIEWRRQHPLEADLRKKDWEAPHSVRRFGARFKIPVAHVLDLDLGDFVKVTHYAGANSDGTKGWTLRVCRIDAIGYDWENRTAELTVVDWKTDYEALSWKLDDSDYWNTSQPRTSADAVTMTASSTTVQFAGAIYPLESWVGMSFQISRAYNPYPWPAVNYATYLPTEAQSGSWEITAVDEGLRQVTISSQYGENLAVLAWRVRRTHTDPPTNTTDPGHYPFVTDDNATGSDQYGRLADSSTTASDGTTGSFSNDDPAYHLLDR